MATINKFEMMKKLKKIKYKKKPKKRFSFLPLIILFLISFASALEFDNVKSFDANTKVITITNNFGIGEKITDMKLDTPQINRVPIGKQILVGEFTINNYDDYINLFNDMKFYDLNKRGGEIQRNYNYKIKEITTVIEDDYKVICSQETLKNGTIKENCNNEVVGKKEVEQINWREFRKEDGLTKGTYTIGLFADTLYNDRVEWIPTLYGKNINEWAGWEASLETGLVVFYDWDKMDGTKEVERKLGIYNLTKKGSPTLVTGKVGNAMNFSGGGNDYHYSTDTVSPSELGGLTAMTWGYWAYTYSLSSSAGTYRGPMTYQTSWQFYNLNADTVRLNHGGANYDFEFNEFNNWTFYVITYSDSANLLQIWIDGENKQNVTDTSSMGTTTRNFTISGYDEGGYLTYGWNGIVDELFIYNRTITKEEIALLYNSGNGLAFRSLASSTNVTLNYPPANYVNTVNNTIRLNCSVKGPDGALNLSLFINGAFNYSVSNTTASENISLEQTIGLPSGVYSWLCSANTNLNQTNSSLRTFYIDPITPQVIILNPLNTTYYTNSTNVNNLTVYINWSVFDPALDSCWYFNGTRNLTLLSCYSNQTSFIDSFGSKYYIFYANDSSNRVNRTDIYTTFDYKFFKVSQTYNTNTIEGTTENFILETRVGSSLSISYATLIYNNVSYLASVNYTGENNTITRTITIPDVTTTRTYPFYYRILLSDGTLITLDEINQTVRNLTVDNCSANSVRIANLTLYDEESQVLLSGTGDNTTIEANVYIKTSDGLITISNYSTKFLKLNPVSICINENLSSGTLGLYGSIRYLSDMRTPEFYNIQNTTLKSSTIPIMINLYDLINTSSTEFLITYKDKNYLPVENALIIIQRSYLSEGVFKTVEIPITDSSGQATGHFDTNNVRYSIIVMKEGQVLASYPNIVVICENKLIQQCNINLNPYNAENTFNNFEIEGNIGYALKFSPNNQSLFLEFLTTDGSTHTINLSVKKFDIIGNNTICSYQTTSSSGIYNCVIPALYGNNSIIATLYSDGQPITQNIYTIPKSPSDLFGNDYILYEIILIVSIVMMSLTSTIGILIALVMGVIASALLFLYPVSSWLGPTSSIVWLIIAVSIVIYKLSKRLRE